MKQQLNKAYTPTQADTILEYNIKLEINTMIIVQVLAFYPSTQTVDVQPVIQGIVRDNNGTKTTTTVIGEEITVSDYTLPPVLGVPICYARAGQAMITIPIQVGDTGMLIISQRDLTNWKQNGGIATQGGNQLFDINDGVFVPFVPNMTNKISDYSASNLEIRFGNDKISMSGNGTIDITGNLTVSGTVTGTTDVVAGTIAMKGHKHDKGTYSTQPTSGLSGVPQ